MVSLQILLKLEWWTLFFLREVIPFMIDNIDSFGKDNVECLLYYCHEILNSTSLKGQKWFIIIEI